MTWRRIVGKIFGKKVTVTPVGEAMDYLRLALRESEHALGNTKKLVRGKKVDITNPEENPKQIIKKVMNLIAQAEQDLKKAA